MNAVKNDMKRSSLDDELDVLVDAEILSFAGLSVAVFDLSAGTFVSKWNFKFCALNRSRVTLIK